MPGSSRYAQRRGGRPVRQPAAVRDLADRIARVRIAIEQATRTVRDLCGEVKRTP